MVGSDTEAADDHQLKVSVSWPEVVLRVHQTWELEVRWTGTHVGTSINDLGSDLGLGPDSYTLVLREFLNEFLLGESPGLVVDLGLVVVFGDISSVCFLLVPFIVLNVRLEP